MGNHLIQ